jgi:hypothetical protein
MRVLLDNCTPRGVISCLREHSVEECRTRGWDRLKNGALLDAAEAAGFEVLITADQGIPHHQNLTRRKIAIVLLGTGIWEFIRPQLDQVRAAVKNAQPGSLTLVPMPTK